MKNVKLKLALTFLKFMRLIFGKSYQCYHVLLIGVHIKNGVAYPKKCGICDKHFKDNEGSGFPVKQL